MYLNLFISSLFYFILISFPFFPNTLDPWIKQADKEMQIVIFCWIIIVKT